MRKDNFTMGSIVQVNKNCPDPGWVGALLIVTKVEDLGIKGYLHVIRDRNNSSFEFYSCKYNEVEYIGRAKMVCIEDTTSN